MEEVKIELILKNGQEFESEKKMCEEETLGTPEKRNRRSEAQEMYIGHGKLDELPST